MAPINDKGVANGKNSRLMTQLQETTVATQQLQQALQPYLHRLTHAPPPDHTGHGTTHDHHQAPDTTSTSTVEHQTVVAKSVVALTLATICYLKPHIQRADKSNHASHHRTESSSLTVSSEKQQSQQIRSDLNHIRQLLKKVQTCRKRKEHTIQQQPLPIPKESSSKRIKRK